MSVPAQQASVLTEHKLPWNKQRMRSDAARKQSRVEALSHAAQLNILIVEILRDEAVQLLPVFWQLEQRTHSQEDAFSLPLLREDLNWK